MAQDQSTVKNFCKYPRSPRILWPHEWLLSSTKSVYHLAACNLEMSNTHGCFSGGGTVDFQEFVGGLSAFSSRGGREEKLRCLSLFLSQRCWSLFCFCAPKNVTLQLPSTCTMSIEMGSSPMESSFWCWRWWWATIWRYEPNLVCLDCAHQLGHRTNNCSRLLIRQSWKRIKMAMESWILKSSLKQWPTLSVFFSNSLSGFPMLNAYDRISSNKWHSRIYSEWLKFSGWLTPRCLSASHRRPCSGRIYLQLTCFSWIQYP